MNSEIVATMLAEEADLLRKLRAVREFLSAYGEQASDSPPKTSSARISTPSREKVDVYGFTEQTRASVVLAMMALAESNSLVRTRDLVEFVESKGHEISGKNKVNALGALLARSVDIVSHGKAGWTLADRDNALAIIDKHKPILDIDDVIGGQAEKENEPDSSTASGPDAAPSSVSSTHWGKASTPTWAQ